MTTTHAHELAPGPGAGSDDPGGPGSADADPNGDRRRLAALEHEIERQVVHRDGWTILLFLFAAVALITSIVGVGFGARAVDESKQNVAMVHLSGAVRAGRTPRR